MNRKQRRHPPEGVFTHVPVKDLVLPHEMSLEECAGVAAFRVRNNMTETGHPYHHRTASGVIVSADPTLQYLMKRLEERPTFKQFLQNIHNTAAMAEVKTGLPKAIPVNRTYYGHDPYAERTL